MRPDPAAKHASSSPVAQLSSPGAPRNCSGLDGIFQVVIASQPIEQWRFETVRAGYQDLLKRAGDQTRAGGGLADAPEPAHPVRAGGKGRANIESILAKSHRRDSEVDLVARTLRGWNGLAPRPTMPSVSFSLQPARLTGTRSSP